MLQITLRYENGIFRPISPIPPLAEGEEIQVTLADSDIKTEVGGLGMQYPVDAAYLEMVNRTRGMWADMEEDIEEYIQESRDIIQQQWLEKLLHEEQEWDKD